MILAYGIVTVLAVIVGSVAGHTLTRYFAKRRAQRQFERLLTKAFEESVDEIFKEISEKQKGNEILKESNHMKNIKLGE